MSPFSDPRVIILLFALSGFADRISLWSRSCNSQSATNALSESSASKETPLINGAALFISYAYPGSRKRNSYPSASTNATDASPLLKDGTPTTPDHYPLADAQSEAKRQPFTARASQRFLSICQVLQLSSPGPKRTGSME